MSLEPPPGRTVPGGRVYKLITGLSGLGFTKSVPGGFQNKQATRCPLRNGTLALEAECHLDLLAMLLPLATLLFMLLLGATSGFVFFENVMVFKQKRNHIPVNTSCETQTQTSNTKEIPKLLGLFCQMKITIAPQIFQSLLLLVGRTTVSYATQNNFCSLFVVSILDVCA